MVEENLAFIQRRSKSNKSGGARKCWRREPLGGSGGMLPQKNLKSTDLEVRFLGELAQFLVGSDKGPSFVRDNFLRSPLRLTTRKKALRKESVLSPYATSKCTALDN